MNYLIKTHRPGTLYKGPHLFVLNRGRHSGRPIDVAGPNCWVIQTSTEDESIQMKQVITCLYQSRQLQPYLIGSVIEFIRLPEFKKLLRIAVSLAKANDQFESIIKGMEAADQLEEICMMQLEKVRMLRVSLGSKLLRGD